MRAIMVHFDSIGLDLIDEVGQSAIYGEINRREI